MNVLRFLILHIIFLLGGHLWAMPAYPRAIPVYIGEEVVYIYLYGDEHCKRAETLDGYTLIQESRKWFFAERDTSGCLKPSVHALSSMRDEETIQFLKSTPRHLMALSASSSNQQSRQTQKTKRRQTAVGNRRILVILMQYKDLSFCKSGGDFERLFNQSGYTEDGAQGSVYDFYSDVSYGRLQLTSDVIGPFTSKYSQSYYGGNDQSGNDSHAEQLFEEAIKYAASEVNLADYDADGDGFVDNVHIIFAGHGEEAGAEQDAIWSHEATLYNPYEIQGVKIDRYSCAPELRGSSGMGISRIGPHCHEIGHALGAMDYYDTNYSSGGKFEGTGEWDVMARGSWNNDGVTPADFNPYVKAFDFGWISPRVLPDGDVNIQASCNDAESYYILGTPVSDEFYLLENRSKEKWGKGVPGEGLLIFHVHSDVANVWNNINVTAPQMCYVVCASSKYNRPGNSAVSYGEINSDGCPYPGSSGNRNFGNSSIPEAFYWDVDDCGIELNNIVINEDGSIHLTNNSIGDAYEPIERQGIFFEGFEGDLGINILDTLGGLWKVEEVSTYMKNFDKLLAYEGNRSLQLSGKRATDRVNGAFEFSCVPTTTKGKLRVKLYVASLFLPADHTNTIRICYRINEDSDWVFNEFYSEENSKWQQVVVRIPEGSLPQIRIEGSVEVGSILGVDNIEVEEEIPKENTAIETFFIDETLRRERVFYTLTGIPLSPELAKSHPGIYIQNGKKIIIR